MALKTILFAILFVICVLGAVWMPVLGILGYVGHYIIGPERQWWSVSLRPYGIRYSFVLAAATAIGVALNFQRLRYGNKFFSPHEKLLLLFVGLLWLLRFVSEPTEFYTIVDHPTVKLTKVLIFGLMLTHVVTNVKYLRALVWTLVVCTLFLSLQAYTASRYSGRLEGVGGPDFAEANFLPVFLGAVLPLIGVLFLRLRWWGKLFCLGTGAFMVNAIILARSRGALVGMALGTISAVLLAPKKLRMKVFAGLIVAGIGGLYLVDPGFHRRMTTISFSGEQVDMSGQQRLEAWGAARQMVADFPHGIGPGNFFQVIGRYRPKLEGRDTHSTFLRCAAELGIPGITLFVVIIVSAITTAVRASHRAIEIRSEAGAELQLYSYGFVVGLCMFLGAGLFVTTIYTEALWWFLIIPVCLERAVANHAEEMVTKKRGANTECA